MDLEHFFLSCQLDSPLKIILFLIASLSIILSMLPQIIRIVKRKSADDISLHTLALVLTHALAKGTFEVMCNVIPLALTSGINGLMVLLGIGTVIKYRKNGCKKSTKFLLLSDTHGALGVINTLARKYDVDAVIHAGDFGFYDKESSANGAEFDDYITGKKTFTAPVFAICGNHDDLRVVAKLSSGKLQVKNLHFLDHLNTATLGDFFIYGLGGNVIPHKLMGDFPAGGWTKPRATSSQYSQLIRISEQVPGPKIFVSHVSPGYEPIAEYIGARTGADAIVSGHMGARSCTFWTPAAISAKGERIARMARAKEQLQSFSVSSDHTFDNPLVQSGLFQELFAKWYQDMLCINLPNASVGAAILTYCDGAFSIKTLNIQR